jgi:hypothetical protein
MSAPPPPSVTASGEVVGSDFGRHGEHPGASMSVAWMPIGRACQQPAFTVSDVRRSQPSTLRQQIERELPAPQGPAEPPSAQIRGCVIRVTGDSSLGTPVLVEKARFRGQSAIVIVAAHNGSDTAWVTTPGCSATADTAPETLPGISPP